MQVTHSQRTHPSAHEHGLQHDKATPKLLRTPDSHTYLVVIVGRPLPRLCFPSEEPRARLPRMRDARLAAGGRAHLRGRTSLGCAPRRPLRVVGGRRANVQGTQLPPPSMGRGLPARLPPQPRPVPLVHRWAYSRAIAAKGARTSRASRRGVEEGCESLRSCHIMLRRGGWPFLPPSFLKEYDQVCAFRRSQHG